MEDLMKTFFLIVSVFLNFNLCADESVDIESRLDYIELELEKVGSQSFYQELIPLVLVLDDLVANGKYDEAKSLNVYIRKYDEYLFQIIDKKILNEEITENQDDFSISRHERSPLWGMMIHREMYENRKCAVSCIGGAIGGAFTGASGGVTGVVFGAVGGAIMGCTGGCVDDSPKTDDDKKDKDPKKKKEDERVKQDDEDKTNPIYDIIRKNGERSKLKDHIIIDIEGSVTNPPRRNKGI